MSCLSQKCFWMTLLLSANWLDGADSGLRLTVRVYDYAGISDTALAKAEREASRIYRQAGLEIRWMECAASKEQVTRFQNCEPPTQEPVVSLNILPPSMETRMRESAGLNSGKTVPGFAVGGLTYVFLAQVLEICGTGKYPQEVILGHVMAHEVGHVLLGDNSHSPQGLMSARFSPGDLKLALNSLLFFDSKQAARMRDRLGPQETANK